MTLKGDFVFGGFYIDKERAITTGLNSNKGYSWILYGKSKHCKEMD
jgi:hypothetical protein